ncbi:uncharacterized protein N7479_007196 [Penicillium vulpinum]|uniref:uncharacterized protein n=1 Tax=Penicillium vulpinum TaxID=29845 RepID=UPI002546A6EA|nr:uncharacterized protein N7479_007196 [Penicillium vulpinum]KAJ5960046.1 hypothetical protein N7479_007196 [Penicillium vulpinum]
MTATWSGLIVAMMGIGSIGGLPLSALSLDKLGRKWGMAIGATIQLVGALVSALAHNITALLIGRFLIGAGLIINGTGGPSWMMEISPPSRRSLFTNLMLALMSIAGTIAAIVALAINGHDTEWVWRGPLLGEVAPPAIGLVLLIFTPESPRWLVSKGRNEEAFDILVRLHADGNRQDTVVCLEFEEIVSAVTYEQEHAGSWKSLVSTIFASVILTLCFILLTILMYKASVTGNTKYGIGGTVIIFIFQWTASSSWMLLAYSYPPEVLTFAQRTRGLSISQAVGYALVTMFSYCLPIAVNNIGYKWYAILACLNAGIFFIVYFVFVETKGKTLEEIDIIFEGAEAFNARQLGTSVGKNTTIIEGIEPTSASGYMPSLIKSD